MKDCQSLLNGILEGEKLNELMNLVGLIFQARVVLFGLSGKPFCWYEHEVLTGGDVHTVESMVIRREELNSATKGTEPLTISTVEIDGQEAASFGMLAPVTNGEEVEYLLGVFDAAEELDKDDVKRVSSILGIACKCEKRANSFCKKGQSEFLKQIMERQLSDSELETLCQMNDFPYRKKRSCAIFSFEGIDTELKKGMKEIQDQLTTLLCTTLDHSRNSNYHAFYNDILIGFIFHPDDMTNQEINDFCLDYYDRIIKEMNRVGISLRVAVGKYYKGAGTIKKGISQAFQAMNLGEEIHTRKRIYSYGCEQLYHILSAGVEREGLQEIFDETIGVLEKYDKDNNNNLTEVVKHLINSGFNLAETAKRMYIHRNTLLYKMEKIKEILGKDPREPKLYVKLILGLYARKILYPKKKRFIDS